MSMETFFAVCPIGWEADLQQEITEQWPYMVAKDGRTNAEPLPEFRVFKGGVQFQAPLDIGLQVNLLSRLSTRVLLRVEKFKATQFSELENHLRKIKFPWLGSKPGLVELQVTASQSQLNHEKRIAETAHRAWPFVVDKASAIAEDTSGAQKIFLRINKDLVSISLDTSGEALFRRGVRTHVSEAPLRETLAHWMLRQWLAQEPYFHLRNVTLVDPMVGSGTLLLEARDYGLPVFSRTFAFQSWAGVSPLLKSASFSRNFHVPAVPWKNLYGFDRSEEALKAAQKNTQVQEPGASIKTPLQLSQRDLFDSVQDTSSLPSPVWVISNPPYDDRIARDFDWSDYFARLNDVFCPERVGLLLPKVQISSVVAAAREKGFVRKLSVPAKNGGIDAEFLILHRC